PSFCDGAPRPAVDHAHDHRSAVPLVRHAHNGTERQRAMRRVRLALSERDAARRAPPLELVRIVRRLAVMHLKNTETIHVPDSRKRDVRARAHDGRTSTSVRRVAPRVTAIPLARRGGRRRAGGREQHEQREPRPRTRRTDPGPGQRIGFRDRGEVPWRRCFHNPTTLTRRAGSGQSLPRRCTKMRHVDSVMAVLVAFTKARTTAMPRYPQQPEESPCTQHSTIAFPLRRLARWPGPAGL